QEVLGSVLDERLRHKDTCVVEEHIDSPESLFGAADQLPRGGHLTHVAIDQQQIVGWSQRSRSRHPARVRHHVEARGEESFGQTEPNAAGSSGNYCCLFMVVSHGYTDGAVRTAIRDSHATM